MTLVGKNGNFVLNSYLDDPLSLCMRQLILSALGRSLKSNCSPQKHIPADIFLEAVRAYSLSSIRTWRQRRRLMTLKSKCRIIQVILDHLETTGSGRARIKIKVVVSEGSKPALGKSNPVRILFTFKVNCFWSIILRDTGWLQTATKYLFSPQHNISSFPSAPWPRRQIAWGCCPSSSCPQWAWASFWGWWSTRLSLSRFGMKSISWFQRRCRWFGTKCLGQWWKGAPAGS